MRSECRIAVAAIAASIAVPGAGLAEETTADYVCEGKVHLSVTFDMDKKIAIVEGGDLGTVTLPQVQGGDNFAYSAGRYTWRGEGNGPPGRSG